MNELSHMCKALEKNVGKKPVEPDMYGDRMEKYEHTIASMQKVKDALKVPEWKGI